MLDLTIAIPVKNEEINLEGCLNSIGKVLAEKIVVIDSGSTDKTKQIAASFGAEVVDFAWDGRFPKKRNWFLRNHTPSTKWILFLDADEYITENFKAELRVALNKDDKIGYWLNYTRYFLGKELIGGYPLKKLALFQVGSGEYERISEEHWSNLDMEVHEHPILSGKIGEIKSKIDHRDFKGITNYVEKHNEYSSWEAARYMQFGKNKGEKSHLTWKQKIKYRFTGSIFIAPIYFFGSYILMGGFMDGKRGFAFALLKMSYFNQVYCKIRELRKIQNGN